LPFTDAIGQPPATTSASMLRYAWFSAWSSIGSPSSVPVACASTYEMSPGRNPPIRIASITAAACPRTPGALNPILSAPSLLTAEDRITARMSSPSRSASPSSFSTTTPTPVPKIVPFAAASNGRQCPSRLNGLPGAHQCP
jgi:hypothetical protein